jgi:hypothetical protein
MAIWDAFNVIGTNTGGNDNHQARVRLAGRQRLRPMATLAPPWGVAIWAPVWTLRPIFMSPCKSCK